jgi:hypothetical protein
MLQRGNKDKSFPTPEQVVNMPMEKLRTAGLSGRKAEYSELCLGWGVIPSLFTHAAV